MAADEHPASPAALVEERLLRRLRAIAVIVILFMVVVYSVGDVLGRLFVDPTFHISDVALGTLLGALLILLGVESASRLPGLPKR